MQQRRWGVGMLVAAVALAGCASTTVDVERESSVQLPPPSVILVNRFAVSADEVTENQGFFQQTIDAAQGVTPSERERQIALDVAERLADVLVERIDQLGLPARRAAPGEEGPRDAVVVTGYFLDIDQGNRLQRTVIGLGMGQATVDAQVLVRQRTPRGWYTVVDFRTHADSGAMPGAALTMGAGAAAAGGVGAGMAAADAGVAGVKAYRSSVDTMAASSADRAADTLSQVFAQQGWIPADRVRVPPP